MTEAGWTREKPTAAGWYWWRCWDQSGVAIVKELGPKRPWHTDDYSAEVVLFNSKGALSSTRLNRMTDGEWLGPITPDSYQHGRVAGLREAKENLERLENRDTRLQTDVEDFYVWIDDQLAQAAQQGRKST